MDEGVAHMQSIGWPELLRRAAAAVHELPTELVYGPEMPEDPWPDGVPVQVRYAAQDPGDRHLLDDDDLADPLVWQRVQQLLAGLGSDHDAGAQAPR